MNEIVTICGLGADRGAYQILTTSDVAILNNTRNSDLILIYEIRMRFYVIDRADKIYLGKRTEGFFMTMDIFNA